MIILANNLPLGYLTEMQFGLNQYLDFLKELLLLLPMPPKIAKNKRK